MVKEQDTWLQTCLGKFGQKKVKTEWRPQGAAGL